MSIRQTVSFLAGIILLNLILYWPNPQMGYVLDDYYVVAQNSVVKHPSMSGIWTSGFFDAANRGVDSQLQYYRPVVFASFALDYQLWGNQPVMSRWVNLLIHVVNSLLIAVLLYLLFKDFNFAATSAVLFSVLPVHEWSVRYITGRGDLLSAFFGLLALVVLVRFLDNNKRALLWGSLGSFLFAVLSKESAILNVGLVGLVAFYVTNNFRQTVRVTGFFALMAISYYVLRQMYYPIRLSQACGFSEILQGIYVACEYLSRFMLPWSVSHAIVHGLWLGLLSLTAVVAIVTIKSQRQEESKTIFPIIIFSLGWIIITGVSFIVTQSIIDRLGHVLSEHFLYMTAVGFVVLVAVLIQQIKNQIIGRVIGVGVLFYFICVSFLNAGFWVNEKVLLEHVFRLDQRISTVAYEQLVMRYVSDIDAVLRFIRQAKSADTQSLWYRRLGDIYRSRGEYLPAQKALAQAVDLNPRNIEAINELAVCHLETGAVAQGVQLLKGSLLISPEQSDAYRLLGILYYRQGNYRQAIPYLKNAWAIDPDQSEAVLHLMMAYYFNDDQKSYLYLVDRISMQVVKEKALLSFVAEELVRHGYYSQAVKVLEQIASSFTLEPSQVTLLTEARQKTPHLSK